MCRTDICRPLIIKLEKQNRQITDRINEQINLLTSNN